MKHMAIIGLACSCDIATRSSHDFVMNVSKCLQTSLAMWCQNAVFVVCTAELLVIY